MIESIVNNIVKKSEETVGEEVLGNSNVRIAVVGVGGGGSNTVTRLTRTNIKSAKTIALNTDANHMRITEAHKKFVFGRRITRGLGAGGSPEVARKAAEADKAEIKRVIGQNEIVFVCAGMGGGTGSGAAPIVARMAKEEGAVVIGLVTYPFKLEGREKKARKALMELAKECDTVIVVDNNKLVEFVPNLPINKAFEVADEIAIRAIRGIADTIMFKSLMNMDYADVKAVMSNGGLAMISLGEASGSDFVDRAISNTLNHPLLEVDTEGAKAALVHIESGPNLTLGDAVKIVTGITEKMDDNAEVKWGARLNPNMMGNSVRVTLIMTGVSSPSILGNQLSSSQASSSQLSSPEQYMGVGDLIENL